MTRRRCSQRLACSRGQSILEFALLLPLILTLGLGVVEVGYALLDQHVVTKLAREGSNLISRDSTLEDATVALGTMSSRPVDFDNGSKVIFSVLRKGATTGTTNFDRMILYQRHEYGSLAAQSTVMTAGGGAFAGAPDYQAVNADDNAGLQVTSLPADLIASRGGMIYVTEIYSTHRLITPLSGLGVVVPTTLYSIAYF